MSLGFALGSAFLRRICSPFDPAGAIDPDYGVAPGVFDPAPDPNPVIIPAITPDVIPSHILSWCNLNGYSDPQHCDRRWWAFPPNGVMPEPISDRAAIRFVDSLPAQNLESAYFSGEIRGESLSPALHNPQ